MLENNIKLNNDYEYYYVFDKDLNMKVICLRIRKNLFKSLLNDKYIEIK